MWNSYWSGRGVPWDYDPGPGPGTPWARLFAETPNYRALGRAAFGREVFRWHFGPMFYRGRLEPGAVRVLLIGQEGAQDESLAHRSFVGGTGARMQHFLGHLGLTRSYLFLNTFVYPIFGQYDNALRPFAQDPNNPIVGHRHRILEQVLQDNDLRLIVTVGNAARDSLETWRDTRGQPLPATVRSVHVMHPGSAVGGSGSAVLQSFRQAIDRIAGWIRDDAAWLPTDSDGARDLSQAYRYRSAPIAFRDLPFGACWRLGRGATSSNRRDNQRAIQLFSSDGRYNNTGHAVSYPQSAPGTAEGYADATGDLPYEPPKVAFDEFDRGPGASLARLMMGGESGLDWPDFASLGLPGHPSFGFGPIARGRLEQASLYVLADQDSHDDLFTARALTGDGGQRLQRFLEAAGLTSRYVIVRALPVDTRGASESAVRNALDHPQTVALHRELLRRASAARGLLAIGSGAERLAAAINTAALPVIRMRAWGGSGALANWNQALQALAGLTYPKDGPASFQYDGGRGQIARIDLPYGTLRWQGSSGDRALQAREGGAASRNYYKLVMPRWAAELPPAPL